MMSLPCPSRAPFPRILRCGWLALGLVACGRDDEVHRFVAENDAFVARIQATQTAEQALMAFEDGKASVRDRFDAQKAIPRYQVKQASLQKRDDSLKAGVTGVCMLKSRGKAKEYGRVCDEYMQLFR